MSFGLEVMVRSALSHIGDLIAVSLNEKNYLLSLRTIIIQQSLSDTRS
ncbi:hypothetical protein MGA5115_03446 [Marinomonas gallaica]|uniref:Uncharacterized protein n=1 Tax=Marinomonas gallaica TaxID=1806667 RepID=A0A1C3JVL2_9GAMM|nr:hypothetical protein MGA5115_03446 [Marinomonas gallaica]SBT20974.1 hypothetical protein MGA5116_01561 [Marinomonas gallaica]